jgi:hypothetical protein
MSNVKLLLNLQNKFHSNKHSDELSCMKKESPKSEIVIGYQEYSPKQKRLHFNSIVDGKPRSKQSRDWVKIGVCTLGASVKIALYCQDLLDSKGKFDMRDVKIAYELYKDIFEPL